MELASTANTSTTSRSRGYTVKAGGLINRLRKARTKKNSPFLEALGVRRRYLGSNSFVRFNSEFGETEEFTFLEAPSVASARRSARRLSSFRTSPQAPRRMWRKLSVRKGHTLRVLQRLASDVKSYARNSVAAWQLAILPYVWQPFLATKGFRSTGSTAAFWP